MDLEALQNFNVSISPQAPLSRYTTFQLGGCCPALYHCVFPRQLKVTVQYLHNERKKFILIGGGSNLLVSDRGVDVAVIRYISSQPIIYREGTDLIVSGSTLLDDLAFFAAEEGLAGLNCTTGIPGAVGGAIVGNAGAFGEQVGDVLKSVTLMDKEGLLREVRPEDLDFRYRYSNLKERDDMVVLAKFMLQPSNKDILLNERHKILETRKAKHPDLTAQPCAGSFFRNIEPTSKAGRRQAAGWFLEQAGAKQLSVGGAKIFERHANIIVKSDHCTAEDVWTLSQKMTDLVKKQFGFDLVREVRFVGEFGGIPTNNRQRVIW